MQARKAAKSGGIHKPHVAEVHGDASPRRGGLQSRKKRVPVEEVQVTPQDDSVVPVAERK
jgi:hypothetical protein